MANSFCSFRDLRPHLDTNLRIQIAQRLVKEENIRIQDQRTGKSHPLLLSSGELARVSLLQPFQVDQVQGLQDLVADLLPWRTS